MKSRVVSYQGWEFYGDIRYRRVEILRSRRYWPFDRLRGSGIQLRDEEAMPIFGELETIMALQKSINDIVDDYNERIRIRQNWRR